MGGGRGIVCVIRCGSWFCGHIIDECDLYFRAQVSHICAFYGRGYTLFRGFYLIGWVNTEFWTNCL